MGTAFSAEAEPMERITSFLMGLTMLMPMVTALTESQALASAKSAISKGLDAIATKKLDKEQKKNALTTIALAVAKGALFIIELALKALSGDYGAVGFALATAAIGGLIVGTIALTSAKKDNLAATQEANAATAEEAKEVTDAAKAYYDATNSLEGLTA